LTAPGTIGQAFPARLVTGGNPDLEPESATYTNLGIIWRIPAIENLRLSVDGFYIDQEDVVTTPVPQSVLDGTSQGAVDLSTEPLPTVFATFFNAAGRKVRGIDFSVDHTAQLKGSVLTTNLSGSYLDSFKVDNDVGLGFVEAAGTFQGGGVFLGGLPEFKGTASVNWLRGPLSVNYNAFYVSEYDDAAFLSIDRTISDFISHDLSLTWTFQAAKQVLQVERLGVTLGVENIFNREPPVAVGNSTGGFDRSNFDGRQRFVYLRLNAKL